MKKKNRHLQISNWTIKALMLSAFIITINHKPLMRVIREFREKKKTQKEPIDLIMKKNKIFKRPFRS